MIHPDTALKFIGPEIGYGVVATKLIPKGTITWAFDMLDQVFTRQQVEIMDDIYKEILFKYTFRDNKGCLILCWDLSKYINHSFHSNCITTPYNFELAVRDIYPGEELTDDYGYLNCLEPFKCLPEPNSARTEVMPDDLLHHYKEWDYTLSFAFHYFNRVDQPLAAFIEAGYIKKVAAVASGQEPADSILNCFYREDEHQMLVKAALLQEYRPVWINGRETVSIENHAPVPQL
jgi:hypothetical protein